MKLTTLLSKIATGENVTVSYSKDDTTMTVTASISKTEVAVTLKAHSVSISGALCGQKAIIYAIVTVDGIQGFAGDLSGTEIKEVHEGLKPIHEAFSKKVTAEKEIAWRFLKSLGF